MLLFEIAAPGAFACFRTAKIVIRTLSVCLVWLSFLLLIFRAQEEPPAPLPLNFGSFTECSKAKRFFLVMTLQYAKITFHFVSLCVCCSPRPLSLPKLPLPISTLWNINKCLVSCFAQPSCKYVGCGV